MKSKRLGKSNKEANSSEVALSPKKNELSLEEIATSTLQYFSQETPKHEFMPQKIQQQPKTKVDRLSTWHNDP